jgi:hypothetical protein
LVIPGIDQADLESACFKNLKERNPVDASGFHRNGLDTALLQPVRQAVQIFSEGGVGTNRLRIAVRGNSNENLSGSNIHACRAPSQYGWNRSLCRLFTSSPS